MSDKPETRNTLRLLLSITWSALRILRFKLRGYYFELSFKIDEILFGIKDDHKITIEAKSMSDELLFNAAARSRTHGEARDTGLRFRVHAHLCPRCGREFDCRETDWRECEKEIERMENLCRGKYR